MSVLSVLTHEPINSRDRVGPTDSFLVDPRFSARATNCGTIEIEYESLAPNRRRSVLCVFRARRFTKEIVRLKTLVATIKTQNATSTFA